MEPYAPDSGLACSAAELDLDAFEIDLTEVEDRLISDDLCPGDTVDHEQRLRVDRMLVDQLAAAGFADDVCVDLRNELARYGIDVLRFWVRTGKIGQVCREHGRPVKVDALLTRRWTPDETSEVVIETVARTLHHFFEKALKGGQWRPERGASLKTFFIGACALHFPNIYRSWLSEIIRWERINRPGEEIEEELIADPAGEDGFAYVESADWMAHAVPDPLTRSAAHLVAWGYTHAEAAEMIGLSARAVEGRLHRLRKNTENTPRPSWS